MRSSTLPLAQRYRPFARIGRGGMAEVLLAFTRESSDTKLVVLKRIWDELAVDSEFEEMFLDEARLSALMNHPNIVQTHEVIEERGRLTMVMEYLDGQPLTNVLTRLSRSDDLNLVLRLKVVMNILAGLDYAHQLTDDDGQPLGVVHRDVSPQNVFITYDGQVKVVDFGVAKTLAALHQTRPGATKGKLAYMAPEQFRGTPVDRRADIFSVGVMLWEMVSGRRLFQGMTEAEIVHQLSMDLPTSTLDLAPTVPEGIEAICKRALAPDPAERFARAADMEADLRRALRAIGSSQGRSLAETMSTAFAAERVERQAIIERYRGRDDLRADVSRSPSPSDDDDADTESSVLAPTNATPPDQLIAPPPWGMFRSWRTPLIVWAAGLIVLVLWLDGRLADPVPHGTVAGPRAVAVSNSGAGEPRLAAIVEPLTIPLPTVDTHETPADPVSVVADQQVTPLVTAGDQYRARSKRDRGSGKGWGIRVWRRHVAAQSVGVGVDVGVRDRLSGPSQELSDPFSIEVGQPSLPSQRREIDIESPFSP